MRMKPFTFFFYFLFLLGSAYGQDRVAQWEEDLHFLETELPKRHKDFYRHYSEPDVRVELSFNEFNRGVDPVWEYIKGQ